MDLSFSFQLIKVIWTFYSLLMFQLNLLTNKPHQPTKQPTNQPTNQIDHFLIAFGTSKSPNSNEITKK
jgi:hypothetical protein